MPLADRALPGISRGVRLLLGNGLKEPGEGRDPYLDAAKVQNEDAKTQGQDIENQVASYVSNLTRDPTEIARAAAAAAGINTQQAQDYYNYRDAPAVESPLPTDGMVHLRPQSLDGITPEEEQALNQFRTTRYGGLTNPKGSKDFMQGLDQGMQTGIARAAAAAASSPNASVSLSQGKPYEPFKVQDNTVIDTGTGDLGPTTDIGQAVMDNLGNMMDNRDDIATARVGTEVHRQRNLDSKNGFAPGRGRGATPGAKELANLPPERRYSEARKMAIRELDSDTKRATSTDEINALDDIDTRTQRILREADSYAHPAASSKGKPQYQQALDYAVGKDPKEVKASLQKNGWAEQDINDIVERSTNFLKLQAAAKATKDPAAFKASALKLGWTPAELQKAMGR